MIALVLQFHQADRARAMELARFIADIEPARRDDVRFRFVARYDCEQVDMDTMSAVGRKFDVSWGRTEKYQWDGWPAGPNGMAKEILETCPTWLKDNGWTDVTGLLMLEPDVVPCCKDWLNRIINHWMLAMVDGCWQMGAWRPSGGAYGHINGNCVIRTERAKGLAYHIPKLLAWDCAIAPYARNHWCKTDVIRNAFQSNYAKPEDLEGCAALHGFKDGTAMELARSKILAHA